MRVQTIYCTVYTLFPHSTW